MDILLHLGAHRTATSGFQAFLWANRAALAAAGLTPWTPRRTRDGLLDGLIRHPMRVTLTDERRAARALGRLRLEFDRLDRAGQSALLISEENLLGTMMNNIEDRGLYPFLTDRMARYAPAFDGRGLHVGLGIRDYADYWASCLGFAIGRGHPAPDRALLDCLVTQPRRWRHLVREIATVFPAARITVWTHEAMAGRARAVTAALSGQGVPAGLTDPRDRHNRGPGYDAVVEALALRGETLPEAAARQSAGRWMPFDADQHAVLHAQYRQDLAWLDAGAEGLAVHLDGRTPPATPHRPGPTGERNLRVVPAPGPAPNGGLKDGIEKGVG
jgi:hypothetical protein